MGKKKSKNSNDEGTDYTRQVIYLIFGVAIALAFIQYVDNNCLCNKDNGVKVVEHYQVIDTVRTPITNTETQVTPDTSVKPENTVKPKNQSSSQNQGSGGSNMAVDFATTTAKRSISKSYGYSY